jgi:hypothetical protein
MDQWREDAEKYGKDPVAREINRYNDKDAQGGMGMGTSMEMGKYKPPAGSLVYSLPSDQAVITPHQELMMRPDGDTRVRPAPDVPMEQWGSGYPSYMVAPAPGGQQGNAYDRPTTGGTSLLPGTSNR